MPTFGRVAPAIPVADLERALRFYRDILGFRVAFTNGEPASFAVIIQGSAQLHLEVQPSKAGFAHAHIMVDDLDAVHERLVRAGAAVRQAPQMQQWGLRDMVIADPDGNTFEIAEPAGERASGQPATQSPFVDCPIMSDRELREIRQVERAVFPTDKS